jgi:cytochrome P450
MQAAGKLKPDGLATAMLKFADFPGIEEKDVMSEIGTFFVAGMDTTGHTLSFFI